MSDEFSFKFTPLSDPNYIKMVNSLNREVGESDRQPCKEYLLVNKLMRTGRYSLGELSQKDYKSLEELYNKMK